MSVAVARLSLVALLAWPAWGASGDLLWQQEVHGGIGCPQLAAADGAVYTYSLVSSIEGELFPLLNAWEPASGARLWEKIGRSGWEPVDLEGPGITVADGRLFSAAHIPTGKFESPDVAAIIGRDAGSGALLWSFELDDPIFFYRLSAIASSDGVVFAIGSRQPEAGNPRGAFSEAMLLALDGGTGEPIWSRVFNLGGGFDDGRNVVVGRGLTIVSGVDRNRGGGRTGILRAYDSVTGRLVWHQETRSPEPFRLVRHRDRLFTLGWSSNLRDSLVEVYDLRTGDRLWKRRIREAILHAIDVAGRTVVVYGQDGFAAAGNARIRAFDRESGRFLWRQTEPDSNSQDIVGSGSRIFTVGYWANLYGLSLNSYRARTGRPRWSHPRPPEEADDAGCHAIVHRGILVTTSGSQPAVVRGFVP